MDSRFQIVHDGSEQSGLTSAYLAGHDNETLASFDAVTQGCKCLAIERVVVDDSRIG